MKLLRSIILLLAIYSAPTIAWWHCDWNYRFWVSISQPPGPPVTDYQVRLNLNASNVPGQFDWSLLGDDFSNDSGATYNYTPVPDMSSSFIFKAMVQ
ncbi:MAG: hypothetical protein O2907_06920 [Proteobacteria bacterium]|nr:hypothetical protein [Pseudomonadota bacterium]MDA1064047.1 hypothetical protein [Pseudomonadota bacterium]